MQAFKVGKFVTYIAIIILLIIAFISPYSLSKKVYFIFCILILGVISLGVNKILKRAHGKFFKS